MTELSPERVAEIRKWWPVKHHDPDDVFEKVAGDLLDTLEAALQREAKETALVESVRDWCLEWANANPSNPPPWVEEWDDLAEGYAAAANAVLRIIENEPPLNQAALSDQPTETGEGQ